MTTTKTIQFTADDFDVSGIQLPAAKKINGSGQAAHLDADQLNQLLSALPSVQWQAVFATAYFTGARISEVLKLDVKSVKADRIIYEAKTTKTKTRREAMITPTLAKVLESYGVPAKGYLFPSNHHHAKKGGHLSRQSAHDVLELTCNRIFGDDHGISTHSFRRSFATNLYRAGSTTAEIQRLLGHKNDSTTSRYIG